MIVTNFLKALAIIAVIVIHVIAADSQYLQQNGLPIPDYFLTLNLLSRFSVPLFVALSGFGLAKSFSSHLLDLPALPGLLRDYFVHRLLRLLPWYLFWGIIIYWYVNYIGQGPAAYGSTPVWVLFMFGKVDYHLYFVPMILVLYLTFPLLWYLVKKFPWPILLAAFLWQVYRYWQLDATTLSDQQQYLQASSWIFYFVLGIFLALRPPPRSIFYLLFSIFLSLIGLSWSLSRAYSQKALGVDPIIFTRFTQIPILTYATGFILMLLPHEGLLKWGPLLSLGSLSYIVYLNHTLVLRLLPASLPFPLLLAITVVISALVAWIASRGWFLFARSILSGSA